MTVKELRNFLADMPSDAEVFCYNDAPEEYQNTERVELVTPHEKDEDGEAGVEYSKVEIFTPNKQHVVIFGNPGKPLVYGRWWE